jgi:hypothetical protein
MCCKQIIKILSATSFFLKVQSLVQDVSNKLMKLGQTTISMKYIYYDLKLS